MKRFGSILLVILIFLAASSPVVAALGIVLQVVSLPQSYHPLAKTLFAIANGLPLLWPPIAVASPCLALYCLLTGRLRRYLLVAVLAWAVSWLSFPAARGVLWLRNYGLARAAQRAQPLISAIETFRAEKGRYPSSVDLESHIRKSIGRFPYTGMVGYPHFEYQKATSDTLFKSYEIRVFTPSRGISFDWFVYWPEKVYPDEMYQGRVERIGEWAYLRE